MGYYSAFKITAQQCEVNPDNSSYVNEGIPTDILKNIEDEIDQFDGFGYRQGDVESGRYSYAKWEEFETDMCLLSRKFPNILFCLDVAGEDSRDLWKAYFINEMVQYCPAVITFDDFTPCKLKSVFKRHTTL